jgi:Tol biopolymer transport system component
VKREGERSLRVKQIATGSEVTVVPARAGIFFDSPVFTPDGNFLYYNQTDPANPNNTNLYAAPSLGGPARQILTNVQGAVTFSPEGKHMAYVRSAARNNQARGEDQLLVSNIDGREEHIISTRKLIKGSNIGYYGDPSWSPSGGHICIDAPVEDGKSLRDTILDLTPSGKVAREIRVPLEMSIHALACFVESSHVPFVASDKTSGSRGQIWFQPYPAGKPVRITNDLDHYGPLSLTADGKTFVTTQQRRSATVYVGESPAVLRDKIAWRLRPVSTEQAMGLTLSWTASGKLLQSDFFSRSYESAADGTERVRLAGGDSIDWFPIACGSGDTIVLARVVEVNNVTNLWRLDGLTGGLRQLTFGKLEFFHDCTADGKWVIYNGLDPNDGLTRIFKVATDGGAAVEVARGNVSSLKVSPDGKSMAYFRVDGEGANAKLKFIVQSLEGETQQKELEAPAGSEDIGWTPDGHALTYLLTEGSAQNLYMQPLAGGKPVRLMHFDDEPSYIAAYSWSRDGKKIAITRSRLNDTDVVMFSGFH